MKGHEDIYAQLEAGCVLEGKRSWCQVSCQGIVIPLSIISCSSDGMYPQQTTLELKEKTLSENKKQRDLTPALARCTLSSRTQPLEADQLCYVILPVPVHFYSLVAYSWKELRLMATH